jgi:transcriptional regulator with XRE-family HTH domain
MEAEKPGSRNALLAAPPFAVDRALKVLGANLRTARLRRNITIEEAAAKIGAGRRAVMDAEKGKPSTGAAVYAVLLWAYGLLEPFETLADPGLDREGLALAMAREKRTARKHGGLDDDF